MSRAIRYIYKGNIEKYWNINKRYPKKIQGLELKEKITKGEYSHRVSLKKGGSVVFTFAPEKFSSSAGKTIVFIPTEINGKFSWDCKSGTLQKYRPKECRKMN